jgi:6-phospho-beta-glucosidase
MAKNFPKGFIQAIHHELVASAMAVKIGHEMIPGAKFGCIILGVPN